MDFTFVGTIITLDYAYDFFVSYSRKDNAPDGDAPGFVSRFVDALKNDEGFKAQIGTSPVVFFDVDSIRTTDHWNSAIVEGLDSAKFLLIFTSPNYFASEFCAREFQRRFEREANRRLFGEAAAALRIVPVPGMENNSVPFVSKKLRTYPKNRNHIDFKQLTRKRDERMRNSFRLSFPNESRFVANGSSNYERVRRANATLF